ncbi:centrosomal protein of 164 kDa [Topomyia yanbarensis]|uniref:centrosomal protein of 164 kDa n=1 Tax=Topomyia yanbarensis TaxID=2498891 RepID=UPI00273ADA55|nr:centrosomal protein of 164 kDa [Topomyia yanbarensis]XP_058836571.1 centrosomal protein of 164 kDa [Topomyia yanbarensis]XP_058836572.1 centrosomal protein of 164 kDa [Topomyia yanbarensis]XP_058836574.1 centrosomal protein of 164 kDa [Topomyia yanbarensis]XP_058836575.1 centrosomal protein of 164 kDa [Topomyia yanbarensis]
MTSYSPFESSNPEEIFYSTYEPSKEEILEYAVKIGIDPEKETNLIYLARQGLLHPLPENWKPCYSKQVKAYYYYDRYTRKSQWEHPIDVLYRQKVADARKAFSHDRSDSTSLADSGFRSLKSATSNLSNNSSGSGSGGSGSACEAKTPASEVGAVVDGLVGEIVGDSYKQHRVCDGYTGSISGSAESDREISVKKANETKEETEKDKAAGVEEIEVGEEVGTEDDSNDSNKENNSQMLKDAEKVLVGRETMAAGPRISFNLGSGMRDRSESSMSRGSFPGFTLTGTGSQFLKTNKKPELDSLEFGKKDEVKGILRDSSLTFVRNKGTPNEDSSEDRKSVRFDIDLNAELKSFNKLEAVRDDSLINFDEIVEGSDNDVEVEEEAVESLDKKSSSSTETSDEDSNGSEEADSKAEIARRFSIDRANDDSIRLLKDSIVDEKARFKSKLEDELRNLRVVEEANNKIELAKERRQFEEQLVKEKDKLKDQHQKNIEEIKEFYQVKLNEMKSDYEEENEKEYRVYQETLQEEFDRRVKEVTDAHRSTMATLQKNHDEIVEELERDLKTEEELLKKEHGTNLTEMKIKLAHELDVERQRMRETGEDRLYEKIRCEKRLLEDKYKCLKEKYTRLKTDVRISLERRKKRREQQQHSLLSNSYETDDRTNSRPTPHYPYDGKSSTPGQNSVMMNSEKSSISTPPPSAASKRFPIKNNYTMDNKNKLLHYNGNGHHPVASSAPPEPRKPFILNNNRLQNMDDTSQSETTYSKNYFQIRNIFANVRDENCSSDSEFDKNHEKNSVPMSRQKRKLFTKTKSASTSKLNSSKHERERPCTPVENLRIQLKKLEELEDQIPECNMDTPYHLRYPFSDLENNGGSSELDFFKHRILLERDSVLRAKESLRTQKNLFKSKQRDISIKHTMKNKHSMDQIFNEEKELTEMEVSLHRTRALLGEKVIRLRHLERSLQKLSEKERPTLSENIEINMKPKETLSDLSSYSSSGFSSTDVPTDHGNIRHPFVAKESNETLKYLEHLHSEIADIWNILNPTHQASGYEELDYLNNPSQHFCDMVMSPKQGVVPSLGTATSHQLIQQKQQQQHHYTVNLLEKTRDLKNWLRQAKSEHELLKKKSFG